MITSSEEFLLTLLQDAADTDHTVETTIRSCIQNTVSRLSELSSIGEMSERQLHRKFSESVGYSPKRFQRIMRMRRLLWFASTFPAEKTNLAGLAAAAEYADQAHMCREVRALAGQTPADLLRDRVASKSMSDSFNTLNTRQ